jgi:hypothetical protein
VKLRIKVRSVNSGKEWTEDYDEIGIGDNGNIMQAQDWAHQLIERFNEVETRRGTKLYRELLGVELVSVSVQHDWYKRTDGMSVNFRGRPVDIFECRNCGITGKRAGLSSNIKRDSRYRAKKFEICQGVK